MPENKLVTLLRADIRNEMAKTDGKKSQGADFHCPFWADAKAHVIGASDLGDTTAERVDANKCRKRLYPLLQDGFLNWWDDRRRQSNEQFSYQPIRVKTRYEIEDLGAVVKVENLLGLSIGTNSNILVYPYMFDEPPLHPEIARLGLWLLSTALSEYSPNDLKLLDVIRSKEFSILDTELGGNEEEVFIYKFKKVIEKWQKLKEDY